MRSGNKSGSKNVHRNIANPTPELVTPSERFEQVTSGAKSLVHRLENLHFEDEEEFEDSVSLKSFELSDVEPTEEDKLEEMLDNPMPGSSKTYRQSGFTVKNLNAQIAREERDRNREERRSRSASPRPLPETDIPQKQ